MALSRVKVSELDFNNWFFMVALSVSLDQMEAVMYFCEPSGTCRMEGLVYEVPLVRTRGETENILRINHECKI